VSAGAYRVSVIGERETAARFKALGLRARDLSHAFAEIAGDVRNDARGLSPKVTGRLAADVRPGAAKTKATVYVGRASLPYAGPINYGWPRRNIAASRFMNRAADDKADDAAETINREMRRLIDVTGLG
jgi:hypothetical protein